MFQNIPGEMRLLPQWVLADMSTNAQTGLPSKIPLNPRTGHQASVTDPSTWGTFEEAIATGYKHIGFVLTANDEFCIIDLDNKAHKPASEAELQRHYKIIQAFDSYTERSTSGLGYHVIVKGRVPSGVHRDKVEVYSQGRYMIMTGDCVHQAPIVERQQLLDMLYGEMAAPTVAELTDHAATLDDADLISMAMHAENSDKFKGLASMDPLLMQQYPSQSEADFALLSMLAFYTRNNEQVRRVFRMTELGKRPKATRDNVYIDRCLMKIRGAQAPEVDMSALVDNARLIVDRATGEITEPERECEYYTEFSPEPAKVGNIEAFAQQYAQQQTGVDNSRLAHSGVDMPKVAPAIVTGREVPVPDISLPPGVIGELATHFYRTAIRPVPEIALVGAIACVAGIVGRSYNISKTGLNQYLVLLAKTGTGKEAAHSGISKLFSAMRGRLPMIDNFSGPSHFASGQALKRVLNEKPCFVSVLGEFGITLQQITSTHANSAERMIKATLLDAFNKSGWSDMFGSTVYSDIEKNIAPVQAPNITILGESTPESFYDWLDPSHIADGLIPRFSIVEYTGDRPERNRNADIPVPVDLLQRVMDLATTAITISNNNTCCPVSLDHAALTLTDAYDAEVDAIMRKSELNAQLWNRAHLKVLKLAALLAVGINPHAPTINAECATWAIEFVKAEIANVVKRFEAGDVGQGDSKQMHDLKRAIEMYYSQPPAWLLKHETFNRMRLDKIIPYSYLMTRTASVASFRNDRNGATMALRRCLQAMVDSGALQQIPIASVQKWFGFTGNAYGIGKGWH